MNGDPPVSREAIFVEKECPFRGMIRGGSVGMEAMIGTEFVASMDSIQQRQDVVVVLQVRHLNLVRPVELCWRNASADEAAIICNEHKILW
jgi:hypothetical protein